MYCEWPVLPFLLLICWVHLQLYALRVYIIRVLTCASVAPSVSHGSQDRSHWCLAGEVHHPGAIQFGDPEALGIARATELFGLRH